MWSLSVLALLAVVSADQVVLQSPQSEYSINVGELGPWETPIDTPAFSFIDKDGKYWFQQSEAEYEINASRQWEFYSGEDIDTAKLDPITHYADPNNPVDTNGNTTWRCNHKSPTSKEATYPPFDPNRYNQANYCDLMGLWVDPDTGDWYGLIHNEFTPAPYGDRLHFDAIDLAVSTDQGKTWDIKEHILTSPYPTKRDDSSVFSKETYYWGAGDQRLHVDLSSGYFYVWYGSRVVDKKGSWVLFYTHAARSPMKHKMRAGSWKKWYDGKWEEDGLGGRESSLVPTSWEESGHVPADKEYKPDTEGTAGEQAERGDAPKTTPMFWMDVSYNAFLGLWIGQPNNIDRSGNAPQEFYATDDLTSQKWSLIGDTGDAYHSASEYRWLIDAVSRTSQSIIGKDFRSYCSYGCSGDKNGEYVNLAIDGKAAKPIDTEKKYVIGTGEQYLRVHKDGSATSTGSKRAASHWKFKATGDGAYTITDESGGLLGVDNRSSARAWGTVPRIVRAADANVGQQWWIIPARSAKDNSPTGAVRIVNRYSGLVLALSSEKRRRAETTPGRFWTDKHHVGRKASEQEIVLKAV